MIQDTTREIINKLLTDPANLSYKDFRELHDLLDLLQFQIQTLERKGWTTSENKPIGLPCQTPGCSERTVVNWAPHGLAANWRCLAHAPQISEGQSLPTGMLPRIELKEAKNMLWRWQHYVGKLTEERGA